MKLKENMPAPDFSLSDQDGNLVSLADFKGKKLALYFYPKDDTPGCTEQACNLRDNIALLRKKGITVIGVSADSARKHKNFEKKYALPFPLLADTDKKMVVDYEVWGEKKMFGRAYMGIHRTTFLINENGIIDHILTEVDTADHAQQILDTWGV
jgi:peroxiredoxin Q/BCP